MNARPVLPLVLLLVIACAPAPLAVPTPTRAAAAAAVPVSARVLDTPTPQPAATAAPVAAATATAPAKDQARVIDPRELAAEPFAFQGENLVLRGGGRNVEQQADFTWMLLEAVVPGRETTENVVVELRPKDGRILRDECYRVFGVAAGATTFRLVLTGAAVDAPLVRGYAWEPLPRGDFGSCADPTITTPVARPIIPPPPTFAPPPTAIPQPTAIAPVLPTQPPPLQPGPPPPTPAPPARPTIAPPTLAPPALRPPPTYQPPPRPPTPPPAKP